MSGPASNPVSASSPSLGKRWLSRLTTSLFVLVAGVGMLTMLVRWFGCVNADEFSPDLFERRSFLYYEVPLVHWQITPIFYIDTTGDLEAFLTTSKYVT